MNKILVFASGTKDSGGSGLEHLIRSGANIIGVVCNHPNGGVKRVADLHNIPFILMKEPYTPEHYQQVTSELDFDLIVLWGWLKLISGITHLPILNVHPGPLPGFGGKGMYGHHVHKAVLQAGLTESAVNFHWVDPIFDHGQIIATIPVAILPEDNAKTLEERVKATEREHYPKVIAQVLRHLKTTSP